MRSTRFKDAEKPDLQFTLGYPSETDKLRLRSGTVLQREVTERERRRLRREKKREKELTLKSNRVTSSSDAIRGGKQGRMHKNLISTQCTQDIKMNGKQWVCERSILVKIISFNTSECVCLLNQCYFGN